MIKKKLTIPALFTVPEQRRDRTSDVLLAIIERIGNTPVTLRMLTDRLGDRTFGIFLILIAVFNVIPLVSILSGLVVVILGVQMIIGKRQARLPAFIIDYSLPSNSVKRALLTLVPKVRRIEKYVRPRLIFTEAPVVDRINGVVITILGFIIILPIPFTNIIPAIVVIFMGIGLSERDGLVQILAACLGVISMALSYYFIFSYQSGAAL